MGCHFLLQGIFPTQGSNLHLLHWQGKSLLQSHQGNPNAKFMYERQNLGWGEVSVCVSFFWLVGYEIRRCYSWNLVLSLKLPSSWSYVSQPCVTQWSYDPCHVGPPKMDGSWWRVLTKHGPLEKGMGNHSGILALRIPWTEWKGKTIWHWKLKPTGRQVSNML